MKLVRLLSQFLPKSCKLPHLNHGHLPRHTPASRDKSFTVSLFPSPATLGIQHGNGTSPICWLVVSTLWKIWKSVGVIVPNIWKNKKCSKPPTRYGDDPGKIIELNRDFHGDIIELGGFSIAIFDDRSPCWNLNLAADAQIIMLYPHYYLSST